MSFDFDIGSFKGQPNYLMRSRKGLSWNNLPPSLVSLVSIPEMTDAIVSFALGPNGHYWLQYEGEIGETVTRTSQGLWRYLNCDINSLETVNRLEFGQAKTYWGTNSWAEEDGETYESIFYNNLPEGVVNQISELDAQGKLSSYSEIGFLAMGMDNIWMLESKGWIWSDGIDPELLEALQSVPEGVSVSDVRLSPIQVDCWWVSYSDGSTHFRIPAHWNTAVTEYGAPEYAMKKKRTVGRSIGLGLRKVGPYAAPAMAATAVGCVLM